MRRFSDEESKYSGEIDEKDLDRGVVLRKSRRVRKQRDPGIGVIWNLVGKLFHHLGRRNTKICG